MESVVEASSGTGGTIFESTGGTGGTASGSPDVPEAGGGGMDTGSGGAAELPLGCDPLTPGLAVKDGVGVFSIRSASSQLCLHAGEVTMLKAPAVPVDTAYSVVLNDTCEYDEWMLEADLDLFGYYEIMSLEVENRVLDIEMGAAEDGTRALLYTPRSTVTGHQRFYFVPRTAATFGIVPFHATGKCVTDAPDGLQILPCSVDNASQSWQLYSEACLGITPEP